MFSETDDDRLLIFAAVAFDSNKTASVKLFCECCAQKILVNDILIAGIYLKNSTVDTIKTKYA